MSLRSPSSRARWPLTVGAIGLAVLLCVLAALQYRWVGEVSDAELERLRSSAQRRAVEFERQFDREITRAFVWFAVAANQSGEAEWQRLVEAHGRWEATAPQPRLVKGVVALAARKGGAPEQLVLDLDVGRVEQRPWPPELVPLLSRLAPDLEASRPAGRERFGTRPEPIDESIPALVIPVFEIELTPEARIARRSGGFHPLGFSVVLLDRSYIREALLPALERRFFDPADGFDYCLQVFASSDERTPFYASTDLAPHPETPDASVQILDIRFDPQNRDLLDGADPSLQALGRRLFGLDARSSSSGRRAPSPGRPPGGFRGESGRWRVALWNRAGGLAEVVTAARRRNLAVSFGILILLGTSVALLLVAAGRAERLARQQMEFVAGVTHELRTPLAVIRSAGENLADGIVADASQVRSYGALVRDEGRRLTEMVEQVLELAGAEPGRPRPDPGPVDVGRLLEDVLKSCDSELRAADVTVEKDVPEDLPDVLGDATALRRAMRNLVENAIKYGGDSRWLGVRASTHDGRRGPEVQVTVEDHGLGIPAEDLPRIFDPFYRGREATSRPIRGSGLGLSLVRRIVESHGGRIAVERGRERGSAFVVSLPAVLDAASPSSTSADVGR